MPPANIEIPSNCRDCLGMPQAIVELAHIGSEFIEQSQFSRDEQGRLVVVGRLSEARQSEIGVKYTAAEDQMLRNMEILRLCSGQPGNCLKDFSDAKRNNKSTA